MERLYISIGSTNPVKINSVIHGLSKLLSISIDNIIATGYNVKSNVSDQPMNDYETKTGAINRAKHAYHEHYTVNQVYPNYSVGLEGGISIIDENDSKYMECYGYIAVYNGLSIYTSKTATFQLPKAISDLITNGMELGDADDQVFGSINSKQAGGTVGHLTNGIIDRTLYYEQAVILAFMPFIWPNLYS